MSDEFKPVVILDKADEKISEPVTELCYALIDTDTRHILNIYSPGTSWEKAFNGARHFESGVAQIVCDVSFKLLPQYKIYKVNNDLSEKTGIVPRTKKTEIKKDEYTPVEIDALATRKFVSANTTTFLAIMVDGKIVHVFPRGHSFGEVERMTLIFGGDMVLVKAKAVYKPQNLAKIEKTYAQIRAHQ